MLCSCEDREPILASISAKDITSRMVKVKSSNVWSYAMNVRDTKKGIGDVYVQFKNKLGGAGDIYVYYDVPAKVYRRWISAPSKGHYFWQYIRNNYMYAKLTGDKRTKLKNGISQR